MGIQAFFVDTPDEDLICQICHNVLEKPVTHCQQGHTYCKGCLQGWLHRPKPKGAKAAPAPHCPGCMLPLGAEVRNIVAENMIAKLRVRCKNSSPPSTCASSSSEGATTSTASHGGGGGGGAKKGEKQQPQCEWVGRLEDLAHHCRTACAYETIPCPNHEAPASPAPPADRKGAAEDGATTPPGAAASSGGGGCPYVGWRKRVQGDHLPQCPHRQVACSLNCGWQGKKLEEARHQGTACPKVTLYCHNKGCHASFERAVEREHYDRLCPHQPVPCVFAAHGCTVQPLRKDQAKHQAEAAVEHASLTSTKISTLEEGMERIIERFEDLRLRVEHSEKATRETIVSLVANPTPGIWIVLYSRIRSWNGGALLGMMNRGAIGYDRLGHAIDLFLDGVVSSTIPALPSPPTTGAAGGGGSGSSAGDGMSSANTSGAAFTDVGLREAAAAAAAVLRGAGSSSSSSSGAAASTATSTVSGNASSSSNGQDGLTQSSSTNSTASMDALKFLERLQQQGNAGTGNIFASTSSGGAAQHHHHHHTHHRRRARSNSHRGNSSSNNNEEEHSLGSASVTIGTFIEEVDVEPN